ncbi:hypothetical protein ACFY20_34380 [Streptomyces sp. NPDC001312]|uniref:hypothetical protein n=1 Tax=Streptomyces sp. NPDC001312 TaxID=3364561 RepID=UPI00368FA741
MPEAEVERAFANGDRMAVVDRQLAGDRSVHEARPALMALLRSGRIRDVLREKRETAGKPQQGGTTPPADLEPPGGVFTEPDDHGLGRSRGGLTTKLHLAIKQAQKPMSLVITAGQRGDSPQFQVLLGRIRVPPTTDGPLRRPAALTSGWPSHVLGQGRRKRET